MGRDGTAAAAAAAVGLSHVCPEFLSSLPLSVSTPPASGTKSPGRTSLPRAGRPSAVAGPARNVPFSPGATGGRPGLVTSALYESRVLMADVRGAQARPSSIL